MIRAMALAVLLTFALGCDDRAATPGSPSVTVFVAASAADAVEQIAREFESETGIAVRVNAAATSTLANQIRHGAEVDLFLAASAEWADRVAEESGGVPERVDLLSNELVVIVPADSDVKIALPSDLTLPGAEVERLALADTDAVPLGIYSRRALEAWSIWPQVRERLIIAQDARHALWLVESGGADAGIVYSTDAAASDRVKVVMRVDPKDSGPVAYPLLLLRDNPAARALFEHLRSAAATEVFRKGGFAVQAPSH